VNGLRLQQRTGPTPRRDARVSLERKKLVTRHQGDRIGRIEPSGWKPSYVPIHLVWYTICKRNRNITSFILTAAR
jgi:hypothetical protein